MGQGRSRIIRASALLVVLMLAAAVPLARWGTRWTVPQAIAPGASYVLQATWDGATLPGGPLQRPIGIAVAPSGDVYVTDALLRVARFDPSGAALGQWGGEGAGPGEFGNPIGVAVGPDGAVYVSDYEQDRVQTFDATGEFLAEFGRPGSGPGEFNAPAGLAVDRPGTSTSPISTTIACRSSGRTARSRPRSAVPAGSARVRCITRRAWQ